MPSHPKHLLHFTKAEAAISILKERNFKPSKVTSCSDPFEIDQAPFFIDVSNERHLAWYCKEMLKLYESDNPLTKGSREAINVSQLSRPERLNFVKELIVPGVTKDKLIRAGDEFDQDLTKKRDQLYVYCFSNCHPASAIAAWSNHAVRHTGVALEFSFKPSENGTRLHLDPATKVHPVKYGNKNTRGALFSVKEAIDLLTKTDDPVYRFKLFEKMLLTKHSDLKWEHEWRLISNFNKIEHHPGLTIKDGDISSIYLGLEISNDNKEQLMDVIKSHFPSIKIFSATKDRRLIKINFIEIKK